MQDAVCMRLHLIGEISNKLPESYIGKLPQIPWVQIVGLRNIIAHQYLEITKEKVWQTVVEDLPLLKSDLLRSLKDDFGEDVELQDVAIKG
jgi:uncharacterized protein with HEPN domain